MRLLDGESRVERVLFWTFSAVAVLFTVWIIILVVAALTDRIGA